MSNALTDILTSIRDKVMAWLSHEEKEVEVFLVASAEYAAKNIKPELMKIVADCTLAAEKSFTDANSGGTKKDFAFGNIVAAAVADAVAFTVADINFAIESVVQHRNAEHAAALANPTPASSDPANS